MAERKIGGRTFKVGEVLATEAILLQARLMQIIGAGVDRLPVILKGAGDASDEAKKASEAAAVSAFTDIFSKCEPELLMNLIRDIVQMASIVRPSGSTENVDVDGDFTQHKADLFPVAVFVLQEVLGDFFTGLRASGNRVLKDKG